MRLKQDGELLIGSSSDAGAYALQVAGSIYNTTGAVFATSSGGLSIGTTTTYNNYILNNAGASQPVLALQNNGTGSASTDGFQLSVAGNHAYLWNYEDALMLFGTNGTERMRIQGNGEVLIGSTTDAGAYALQVAGSIYNTTGAVFAASSGDVGIGRTSPTARLSIAERGASNAPLMDFYGNAGNSNYMWTTWYTSTGSALSRLNVNGTVSTSFGTGTSSPLIFITNDNDRMTIKSDGEVLIGSSSDAGTFALQVTGAIYNTTTLTTGAPTSGTAKPWRLGEAATVSPTSPNRTIRVEIDGTVYYIHAKTTND
jgi:hypothetical protein